MPRRARYAISLILAVLFVWVFLRRANPERVLEVLTSADLQFVGGALIVVLFTNLQRAWRWGLLLRPLAAVHMRPLLECTLMGWTMMIVAGRLGEVARPVLLSRRTEVRASAAMGSVVLERAFDALAVLVVLAAYLAFFPVPTTMDDEGRVVLHLMRTIGFSGLVGVLSVGTVTVALLRNVRARAILERVTIRWLPARIGALFRSFFAGMAGLRNPSLIARISLSSLGLWVMVLLTYVLLFHAFALDLPWYAAIPVVVLAILGVMVPTPAAVGSFHAAVQVGLVSLWGVDNEVAVAYAILIHAVSVLPVGLLGAVLLVREGVGPGSLSHAGPDVGGAAS